MKSGHYTAYLWGLFMKIHGRFGADLDFRRAELLNMSNPSWKFNGRESKCWVPCSLTDWPGPREDGDGEWSFLLALQTLGRSPGQVGNASPASSHCLPDPVPQGRGMEGSGKMLLQWAWSQWPPWGQTRPPQHANKHFRTIWEAQGLTFKNETAIEVKHPLVLNPLTTEFLSQTNFAQSKAWVRLSFKQAGAFSVSALYKLLCQENVPIQDWNSQHLVMPKLRLTHQHLVKMMQSLRGWGKLSCYWQ